MIIGQKIPSGMFFWHHNDLMFSQDISSLKNYSLFGQLYDDACDAGFVMVSDRTGEELPFYLHEEVKGDDYMEWIFKPVTRDKNLQRLSVVVFND